MYQENRKTNEAEKLVEMEKSQVIISKKQYLKERSTSDVENEVRTLEEQMKDLILLCYNNKKI